MSVEIDSPALTAMDRKWFAEQVEASLGDLFGAAVRLCRDRTDAEDLVATAVAKAWEALPSLEDRRRLRGWMFRILSNTFLSQRRSARAQVAHEPLDTVAEETFSLFERLHQPILLWWGSPELDFLNRLLRDDIERAIDSLPEGFRTVVVMVDVQGLTYRDVAEILDLPIGTVRSRLARARSRLQRALWEHALEAGLTDRPRPSENDQ